MEHSPRNNFASHSAPDPNGWGTSSGQTSAPATAGEPLQIDRSPLESSAASFRDKRILCVCPDLLIVKQTFGSRLFYAVFFMIGLGVLIIFGAKLAGGDRNESDSLCGIVFTGLGGLVFTAFGVACLVSGRRIDINLKRSEIRFKRNSPTVAIADVFALQIVTKIVPGDSDGGGFTAYQLNLVLSCPPGWRLNIMCHGNEKALRSDAALLGQYINKPVLDQTGAV